MTANATYTIMWVVRKCLTLYSEENQMDNVDRLLEAQRKDRAKPPKRLSSKYRHYVTTTTIAEKAMRNIERINRNAPIKIIKKGKV